MIVVSQVSEVFYPVLPGGLAQLFRYGPGLKERGIQLRVHTTLQAEHGDDRAVEVNGIEIRRHRLADGVDHHRERALLIRRALEGMSRDGAEVSHCLQPNGGTWRSTALLWQARMRGIASTFYFTMFPESPPARADKHVRHLIRLRALHAPYTKLIFSSHRMRAAFEQVIGSHPDKMAVLPNGVDLDRFSPVEDRRAFRRKMGLPEDGRLVLYCGSVTPRKGIDLLLDAWDRLADNAPDARLVILGSVGMRPTFRDPAMRDELTEFTGKVVPRLERLQARGSVILPGEVDCVEDYLRAVDVFAFPSRREGLPNAVLEAMASGLPCVIAPFAGMPDEGEEFGHHEEQFIRSAHDPDRLAADMLRLIRSPQEAVTIGRAARAWMERTQHPDRTLDVLAGIYRSATGRA